MKLVQFLCFFLGITSLFSQEIEDEKPSFDKQNELSVNVFDLVVAGTLDVSYERYFKNNQSFSAEVYLFDHFAYYDLGYDGYKSKAFTFKGAYNVYFGRNKDFKGFVFYPYMKFRTGKLEYKDYYYYGNGMEEYMTYKNDVSGFQVGFGLGNKWRIVNNRISLKLTGEIGRELGGKLDSDIYSKVEPRLQVMLGFTF